MTVASSMPELLQPKAVESKPSSQKAHDGCERQSWKLPISNLQSLAGESAATRGNDVVNISTMTDSDFEKLSAAQMQRLRGDFG